MYTIVLSPRYVIKGQESKPALVLEYEDQKDADLVADALRKAQQVSYIDVEVIPSKEVDVSNLLLNMSGGLLPKDLGVGNYPKKPELPPNRIILEPQGYEICNVFMNEWGERCRRLKGHKGRCIEKLSWWRAVGRQFGIR